MATSTLETVSIPVSGMHCAGCSATVQSTLEHTPGVAGANVNLMTNSATVDYDPLATTPELLVEAIRETGYGAELPRETESAEQMLDARDEAHSAEIADLRRKVWFGLIASILVMLFSMPLAEMVPGSTVDPLMRLMMPLVDGLRHAAPWIDRVSADGWRYLLLGLTLPMVGWAGRHFYSRAWVAFRRHTADMNTLIALGTGAALRLDRHMTFDVGYRFSHVAADTPLHVQSVTFGVGYRF